jgi:hypothetical protein
VSPRTDPEPYSEVHSYFRGDTVYRVGARRAADLDLSLLDYAARSVGYGRSLISVPAVYAVSA